MCASGISTQTEDLYAAGAEELIHVGFAGGHNGMKIGDYVISDGAYTDSGLSKLYGITEDIIPTCVELTDRFCEELKNVGITFHRGCHWTMGISEYDISKFLSEGYKSSLPTIEVIEAEFGDIE